MLGNNNNNNVDEVEHVKKAATAKNPSDNDGAGSTTVFDKILSGEWSCNKAYKDDFCLAFHNVSPQACTHIILIPKHRDGLTRLSHAKQEQKTLLGHLMYVAQEIQKKSVPMDFVWSFMMERMVRNLYIICMYTFWVDTNAIATWLI
jgi:histidine triad (HIT) family protein